MASRFWPPSPATSSWRTETFALLPTSSTRAFIPAASIEGETSCPPTPGPSDLNQRSRPTAEDVSWNGGRYLHSTVAVINQTFKWFRSSGTWLKTRGSSVVTTWPLLVVILLAGCHVPFSTSVYNPGSYPRMCCVPWIISAGLLLGYYVPLIL